MKPAITLHAIERYQQRVADLPAARVIGLLQSRAFACADDFGAPFVRLAGGQRAVIRDHTIVTILPAACPMNVLDRRREHQETRIVPTRD